METQAKIWCDKDEHKLYEVYADFNEWLEGEEGQLLLDEYGINGLSQPSKAFFAGDKAAYDEAFKAYRKDRRHEALNESYLVEQFGDEHWFDHNLERFDQLVHCLKQDSVVPFIFCERFRISPNMMAIPIRNYRLLLQIFNIISIQ
jgi:hypothetical protein